ncbi:MAG: hypothetical protein AMXMBFR7_28990 [Planctomycetota bacterium]
MNRQNRLHRLWIAPILCVCAWNTSAQDDLTPLSDEFDDPATWTNFQRVSDVEEWNGDQLEAWDIGETSPGRLMMMPYTNGWYNDYRGVLAFKPVSGDFVVTTDVETHRRGGAGAPEALYSLAGIMVRTPKTTTRETWAPGGENYIFLSVGSASNPGTYQHEVKTTVNSVSTLDITPATARVRIQVARIGSVFICLRRPEGGAWVVHRRYSRPDMPATMQVGLTTYTDWNSMSGLSYVEYNQTVLTNGNPDLVALFDYLRYRRPAVPANLVGLNFADPAQVSDAQLLAFLGANADLAAPPPPPPVNANPVIESIDASSTPAHAGDEILFTATAGDPDGNDLTYSWDFGDGEIGSGAQTTHAYAAPGTYEATLTVNDGNGGTDVATLEVVILAVAPAELPLALKRIQLSRNFKAFGRDKASFTGTLAVPQGFVLEGATVQVDVGGVAATFVLDRRGIGRSTLGTFKLNPRSGSCSLILLGNLGPDWVDEGLANLTATKAAVAVDVLLRLGQQAYTRHANLLYTARLDKTGKAVGGAQ